MANVLAASQILLYLVEMKQCYWCLAMALMLTACQNKINPNKLPSITWQPVDSVFSYYVEKDGDHVFKSGDLLGIVLEGGIDKKSHQFSPVAEGDSTYSRMMTKIAEKLLNDCLNNKIKSNAEGYIKADFARMFPDQQVVIQVYLKENIGDADLDTLKHYISGLPQVSAQHYTSKDDAKKQFLAAGNADFSAVLDHNPLPASLELTVNEDYCAMDQLAQLKKELENRSPSVIAEVRLPDRIVSELRKIKTQECIFHFKT